MDSVTTIGPNDEASVFSVEVRRPLHRPSPWRRLRERWRVSAERRRAARARRKAAGKKVSWWEGFDVPLGEMDSVVVVVVSIVTVIVLVALAFSVGPFVWLLVLFVVELAIWLLLALVGLVAWLVLGRPWQVSVVDRDGVTVASVPVRGRRSAHERAVIIQNRLAGGATPSAAVCTP